MRWLACLLLALPLCAAPDDVVRSERFHFAIKKPDSLDWDIVKPTQEHVKAHFRSAWDGGAADVSVLVSKTAGTIDELAKRWQTTYGAGKARRGKLGGQPAVVTDAGPVTWILARDRDHVYVLYIFKTGTAIGDEDVASEIDQIRDSFRFLEPAKTETEKGKAEEGAGEGEEKADPALEPKEIYLRFWRLRLLKPQGFKEVPAAAFTQAEKDSSQIYRCEQRKEQTRCVIRVFAFRKGQRFRRPIDKVAQDRIDQFAKTYKKRLEPEQRNRWKVPLVKEGITLKLVGKRGVPEISTWYLAECRNGVQYQVQVYVTGAHGEQAWAAPVRAFLRSFRPVFDRSRVESPGSPSG